MLRVMKFRLWNYRCPTFDCLTSDCLLFDCPTWVLVEADTHSNCVKVHFTVQLQQLFGCSLPGGAVTATAGKFDTNQEHIHTHKHRYAGLTQNL